ncbi:hypothetical protein ILUMI_03276 [Ignelater luminosus]|uniref:Alcohol dehydrogenase n=1 Tax=Ignelater luminosus TaxID=2038154 RepID=A0A8K0GFN3_IGNLU|nr:hypothetical protein ILUMI_03276 [Ignelater luminosus]
MSYDLKGKVALITGGAVGIGFSCAKEILRFGAQAVVIIDIDETKGQLAAKELAEEFGPEKVLFIKVDVTKSDELEDAIKKTISTWKKIDVMINNAAILNDGLWELEIFININALVQGNLLGLKYMSKKTGGNGGVIINMSSIVALQATPACPIYSGTKNFVIGFSRSLGDFYHYNRTGVKVITLCPGVTDTAQPAQAESSLSHFLFPELRNLFVKEVVNVPRQPASSVGLAATSLITKANSGTVWVAEDNKPAYEIIFPDRTTLRKQ